MESNTFYDIYLEELKNLPQGTPEEETALLKKLTEGDKTAASRLTELKLAKAVQIAEEYHDRGLPAGDLVQEANMALFLFASEYENGDFDAQMEKKVRALAIAHLVNRYINAYIGKLSPMCSCVMASSTAASVGIAYLLGGSDEQLGYAVRNMSGTVTGMICDGGKVGCAMKVATGSSAALLCALTAVHDAPLRVSDGICAETPEDCIRHMAQIGNQGMAQTDKEIIHIMEQKK